MKRAGFTMTEMLVVIVIIATLAGIAYPITTSLIGNAREAACLQKLRSIGIGFQAYLQDNNNRLPELAPGRTSKSQDIPVIETVLKDYIGGEDAFHCPADREQFLKSGSSYGWNSTQNGLPITQLSFFGVQGSPELIPLITDKEAWHPHGTNILYADSSSSNKLRFQVRNPEKP